MIFDRIQIQNFLSIKSINLDLKDRGLLLLNGKNLDNPALNNNGAGKSSILEAIIYALFGRTIRGLKGDQVVNNITNKNTKVFLDIIDDDGTPYRLARYRKHHLHKNSVFLYRNGKDITPKSESDFDDYITNLLQADYSTFTSSLLYSAESFKFTTATDAEIKKTFDTMLNLETFSSCRDVTRQILTKVRSKMDQIEHDIDAHQSDIEQFQDQINAQTLSSNDWQSTHQAKINTIMESQKSLVDKAKALHVELQTLESDYSGLESDIQDIKQAVDQKKDALKRLDDVKATLSDIVSQIKDTELNIKGCRFAIKNNDEYISKRKDEISSEEQKIDKLELKIDYLHSQLGQPCPTCGRPLTDSAIESAASEYHNQIDHIRSHISEIDNDINAKLQQSSQLQDQMYTYASSIDSLSQEKDRLNKSLEKANVLEESIAKMEKRLEKASKFLHSAELEITAKKSDIKHNTELLANLDKELSVVQMETNPFDSIISSLSERLSLFQQELTSLQSQLAPLADHFECLSFWDKAFSNSGIKSFILDSIIPFLNRRTNHYLSKLSSNQIEVIFSTTSTLKSGESRERFNINVVNHNGGSLYSSNSGGERKRIDLSINLALQDLVAARSTKRINLSIIDEVFDALDENGIDSTISLLNDLSSSKSTILVVSHNEYLKSFFTNVLTVTKEGGFSTLQEGVQIEQ